MAFAIDLPRPGGACALATAALLAFACGTGPSSSPGDEVSSHADGQTMSTSGEPDPCLGPDPGLHPPMKGERLPHVTGVNAWGEPVRMCTLEGKPLVVDVSTMWCDPCNQLGAYLAGDDSQDFINDDEIGPRLREMVNAGTIVWVTMLTQDINSKSATVADAMQWEHDYPNDNVIVFVPDDLTAIEATLAPVLFPTLHTADHEYNWLAADNWSNWDQFRALIESYG